MKALIRLDATALKKSACKLNLKRAIIDGYRKKLIYNDTLYGVAGHKFSATLCSTKGDFAKATMEATKVAKQDSEIRAKKQHLTVNHLIKTCLDFHEHLSAKDNHQIIEVNGAPFVEQQFAIKVHEDEYMIMELCGTIDKVDKVMPHGQVCIGDYKYTSSWDTTNYFLQHRMGPQLMVYRWAFYKMAEMAPEDSELKKLIKYPVGMYIDGIFLKSQKETEFHRSEVWTPTDEQVAQFDFLLMEAVKEVVKLYHDNEKGIEPLKEGMINGACANSYGTSSPNGALCEFFFACSACDKIAERHILRNQFIQREYDPLSFGEEV